MRIWNTDGHAAVITDVKKQVEAVGHSVDSWNLSGHHWTQGLPHRPTWRSFKLDVIWDYSPEKCKQEHGEHLSNYDAMLVCYPPCLVRIFDAMEKPMIQNLCVRYDLWTSDNQQRWESYQEWFIERHKQGRLHLVANSLYDVEYCRYFTGITPKYIQSISDYVGESKYNPDGRPPLIHDARSQKVISLFTSEIPGLQTARAFYGGNYKWEDIPRHKAMVWVPYNASIMSFYENYWMGIPIFCPTQEYLIELKASYSAVGEITHRQCSNHYPPGSFGKGTFDAPDPNQYDDLEATAWWFKYFDFYTFPHITYFSSLADLREKLATTDLQEVSRKMIEHNLVRKTQALDGWRDFLATVK